MAAMPSAELLKLAKLARSELAHREAPKVPSTAAAPIEASTAAAPMVAAATAPMEVSTADAPVEAPDVPEAKADAAAVKAKAEAEALASDAPLDVPSIDSGKTLEALSDASEALKEPEGLPDMPEEPLEAPVATPQDALDAPWDGGEDSL